MQNNPTDLIRSLKSFSLTEERRLRMRDELMAFADMHAVPAGTTVKKAGTFRASSFSLRLWYGVAAFVFIFTVGGSGAALAAENSVPGDVLYKVKVSVAEPVQGALITTPEGKAKWHSVLAERRLEETTTLAAKNELTADKQQYLATQFTDHVDTAATIADSLDAEGDTEASLDIHSDLEARLIAHADILSLVADHLAMASSTEDAASETRKVLALVQQQRDSVSDARVALEDTVAAQDDDGSTTMLAIASHVAVHAPAAKAPQPQVMKAMRTFSTMSAPVDGDAPEASDAGAMQAADTDVDAIDADQGQDTQAQDIMTAQTQATAAFHAAQTDARASEVASILLKHAALLKALGITAPIATSTEATTTATSTDSSDDKDSDDGDDD